MNKIFQKVFQNIPSIPIFQSLAEYSELFQEIKNK